MKRFIVFCILISPAIFLFGDFKAFWEQINPMTNWEILTRFVGVYLFPAIFLSLFIFYPKKINMLAKSLILCILCIVSLFLLNISNEAISPFRDDILCFTFFAYSISLGLFFYACFYSLFISREKYTDLIVTFVLYHWWFIYIAERQFDFKIDGFVTSGTLVLANAILLLLIMVLVWTQKRRGLLEDKK
jgi:membrane-associated HD superfamily phosphohydrolase